MRRTLLGFIFAGAMPLAMTAAPSEAPAAGASLVAKHLSAPSAATRVDYRGRYYGHRPYYRRYAGYRTYAPRAYYAAPRYYAAPAYYAPPPVVYYPPPVVVYYPPPVVAYPAVAPYRYGAPSSVYYDGYADW